MAIISSEANIMCGFRLSECSCLLNFMLLLNLHAILDAKKTHYTVPFFQDLAQHVHTTVVVWFANIGM